MTGAEEGAHPRTLHTSTAGALIPSWAKDASSGSRLFNARGETVSTRPSFREAFKARRIIVPADGFYEWRKQHSGSKQPHYFTRTDGEPMAMAGVAEWWRDKTSPQPRRPSIRAASSPPRPARTWTAFTTACPSSSTPTSSMSGSTPEVEDINEALLALVRAAPMVDTVTHRAVSQRVGSVRNNDPELIAPIENGRRAAPEAAAEGPATLF